MIEKNYNNVIFFTFVSSFLIKEKYEAKKLPTYTINTNSLPIGKKTSKISGYNNTTKHTFVLRSYMEKFEKTGGGTLILKKGTYNIANVVYVPSNVTIKLQNGVVLKKGKNSGLKNTKVSLSMFQLIRPSYANKKKIYGGHKGEKNITFVGQGNAYIDMNFLKDSIAIISGHNRNIVIKNIKFRNMYSGHFIELDAGENIYIDNNDFRYSKASSTMSKEAINLDTPDKLTGGWSREWSKFDATPNNNVFIRNNVFKDLDTAIGTHQYSNKKLHNKIYIQNNIIQTMRTKAIRVMNWSNSVIEKNNIKDIGTNNPKKNINAKNAQGIVISGASNLNIKNNKFENMERAFEFVVWKNSGKAAKYPVIYNNLSKQNISFFETNTIKNGLDGFVRNNTKYNDYLNNVQTYAIKVISLKIKPQTVYALRSGTPGFLSKNMNSKTYVLMPSYQKFSVYKEGNGWFYNYQKDKKGNYARVYYYAKTLMTKSP